MVNNSVQSDRLLQAFFNRNVVDVAKDLLGKTLVFGDFSGIITETEAYGGEDDAASHAFKGPSLRCNIMFGPSGFTYVYLIYGMYHCLNIVTGMEGCASAVLIRGVKLNNNIHLNGPGKLCKYMNINLSHNRINLTEDKHCYILNTTYEGFINATPRIGINKNVEPLWRFCLK